MAKRKSLSKKVKEENARLLAQTEDLKSEIADLEEVRECLITIIFSMEVLMYREPSRPRKEFPF